MKALSQIAFTLQCLALSLLVSAVKNEPKPVNVTIEKTIELRTHSLYAPYIDQDLQNRWFDFGADAYINTNKYVRLTRAKPSQMGWLWSRLALTASNYIIEIEFQIGGPSPHLYGDGFALWLTRTRAQPGPVFGSIDNFDGLGIFFDTYANSRHSYSFPRVTAMLGDGKTSYDHAGDGEANSIGSCSANYRRVNVPTKVRLEYIKDKYLDVKVQYKGYGEYTDCFRTEGISIPTPPFLGMTALTGDVFDGHDIISITTYTAIVVDPSKSIHKLRDPNDRKRAGSGSWTSFILKFFLFMGLCVGAFYGYQVYTRGDGFSTRFNSGQNSLGSNMFGSSKRF